MTCDKVFERVITKTSDTSLEDNSSLMVHPSKRLYHPVTVM